MSTATLSRPNAPTKNRRNSKNGATPTAARQAFLSAVRSLESVESPGTMQVVTQALTQALTPVSVKVAKERETQLEWKALQRAFEFRRALLKDAITTAQVAELLGVSRQAVGERERKGQLLGEMEGGHLRFPLWQFDPAGSGGVVEGLPQVLRALDEGGPVPPLGKMSWLQKKNCSLGGDAPLEALRQGRLAEVLAAARGALAV